nr:MAG TPA: hypothetical protein [Caudoviricetes sp.]DAG84298.1 MAG TPA: hypothetical protein [Caudoviricetes sp.]
MCNRPPTVCHFVGLGVSQNAHAGNCIRFSTSRLFTLSVRTCFF